MSEKPAIAEWEKEGFGHIWLPYTQMKNCLMPLPVVSASNCTIKLEDGRELIDGIASWWSACHGYSHPHITEKVIRQIKKLPHIMLGGLAHEQAYILAKRLTEIVTPGLERVFFSDSGSVAIEVAMKMATQFWFNKENHKKNKFICFRNGYHGDTMGPMSLTDPDQSMHKAFNNYMPKQYVVDIPNDEYSFAEFSSLVEGIKKTVAGIVIEPLVQGAGGMKFHSADILAEIYRICKKNDIIFIADEIATGFGRTGSMFACEEAGISPDIMCLGKALTGGTCGLAATLATKEIFEAFLSDNPDTALMHGPTFMGNPIACAAANASLDLFEKEPRLEQINRIEEQLLEELASCRKFSNVIDVRIKGAIGVVQLNKPSNEYILELRKKFIEKNVWLRPFGDIIYIMPAFTISKKELSKLTKSVYEVLS